MSDEQQGKDVKAREQEPDSADDWKIQRDAEKQLGDVSFRSGDYRTAILHYTAALSVDPDFDVALSNRSACYMKVGDKSRALHDAQACVKLGTFRKGYSRLAAALQSLGRYEAALENWDVVLLDEPNNAAALQGRKDCQEQINKQKKSMATEAIKEQEPASTTSSPNDTGEGAYDALDDFFNEVEEAASEVAKEKQQLAAASEQQQATNAIKHQKKDLGTASDQIDRILAPNFLWRNLNPFFVLDLPHTSSKDDISRRFKALSLLLHPDKNPSHDRAQDAYDQVLKAKAALDDELKYGHAKQLVEQAMKQGRADWERGQRLPSLVASKAEGGMSLEECQTKAVQRIFAAVEHSRRQVEQRERSHEQREREKEEAEAEKVRNERKFDKSWKEEERVEKRIGNWRDFAKQKKSKS